MRCASGVVYRQRKPIGPTLSDPLLLRRSPLRHPKFARRRRTNPFALPPTLEFLGLEERHTYSESELETAIIDRLQQFLLELGKGFLFEARQKRFSFGNQRFFVDLVFYNRLLRCYVLIDLKRGELIHQDLGQMQMYVDYFDCGVKADDELPTVGILLCDRKDDAVIELTLPANANVYASKYQLYLPSKQDLAAQLARVRRELEERQGGSDE